MANAPRAAWSELGKPLKWLYDALQLRDQDLPNVLSAAEISSTIDATQNGYAERRHFSLELQGTAAHVSPGVLFGPDAQVNTWAGLQLVTSADLRTDDDAILIHGISLFNGSAGAAGVEFRVSASQVLATDLAAALFVSGFSTAAGVQTSWYTICSGSDRSIFVPPGGKLIVSGMNVALLELQILYTRIRAGHRPVR